MQKKKRKEKKRDAANEEKISSRPRTSFKVKREESESLCIKREEYVVRWMDAIFNASFCGWRRKREREGGRGDDGRENILAARMGAQEGGFMHRLRESNSSSDYKGGKNTLMRRKSCGKLPCARKSRVQPARLSKVRQLRKRERERQKERALELFYDCVNVVASDYRIS